MTYNIKDPSHYIAITGFSSGYGKGIVEWVLENTNWKVMLLAHRFYETREKNQMSFLHHDRAYFIHAGHAYDFLESGTCVGVIQCGGIALDGKKHINDYSHHTKATKALDEMYLANTKPIIKLSHKFANTLGESKGTYVYISSISSVKNYPKGGMYCATKSASEVIIRTLRAENMHKGIRYTILAPGLGDTNFLTSRFNGDVEKANYFKGNITPMQYNDLAESIMYVLQQPKHICVNRLEISPVTQAEHGLDVNTYKI